jgi:hypothetical protein
MRHKIYFALILLLSVLTAYAQEPFDTEMSGKTNDVIPSDNIYIQTDKEVYKPSEIIWFKAYILDTYTQQPSTKNYTLFIVLKNKVSEEVVFEDKFKIVNGFSNGDIFIEEKWSSGDYYLSAFTRSSLGDNSLPIASFKRISVKNDETKLLMESQFDKEYYTKNSDVKVKLIFYNNHGEDLYNEKVKITHYKDEKLLVTENLVTDDKGIIDLVIDKAYIDPEIRTKVLINNKIKKVFNLNIPYSMDKDVVFNIFPEGGKLINNLPNKVAFKATNNKGKPISVKGEVFEDEEYMFSFKSLHDGMGFFKLIPQRGRTYSIRLSEPVLKKVYFPVINDIGYVMSVIKNSEDFLKVHIEKSMEIKGNKISLMVKTNGKTHWKGTVNLNKSSGLFSISKKNLPKGILELTLFDNNALPVAERLVYVNTGELQIENLKSVENKYTNKDKVELKFKVEDKDGQPVIANLGIRVYDNAFYDPSSSVDIQSHYNLFSNLKGKIYKPFYYFDTQNKYRHEHLDLLLLTHGWRNYAYSKQYLADININGENRLDDFCRMKIYELDKNNNFRNLSDSIKVDLIWSKGLREVRVYEDGMLNVPFIENDIILIKPPRGKGYRFTGNDAFRTLSKIINYKPYKQSILEYDGNSNPTKKQLRSYFAKNNIFLDVVNISASKNRGAFGGSPNNKRSFAWNGDYVCSEYEILNCSNHIFGGFKPINGKRYRTNQGNYVVYISSERKISEEDLSKKPQYVKGYALKKEFFSPNYDLESKEEIDTRTTLAWEPNLITDENGFANYSFYTSEINSSFTIHVEGVDINGNIGSQFYNFSVRPEYR